MRLNGADQFSITDLLITDTSLASVLSSIIGNYNFVHVLLAYMALEKSQKKFPAFIILYAYNNFIRTVCVVLRCMEFQ